MALGRIEDESLGTDDALILSTKPEDRGRQPPVVGRHGQHVAARLHVARPPRVGAAIRGERRGLSSLRGVERDLHAPEQCSLRRLKEVRRVRLDARSEHAVDRELVIETEEHLIGGVGGRQGGRWPVGTGATPHGGE